MSWRFTFVLLLALFLGISSDGSASGIIATPPPSGRISFWGPEEILGGSCSIIMTKESESQLELILSVADRRGDIIHLEALTLTRDQSTSLWAADFSAEETKSETQFRTSMVRVSRHVGLWFKNTTPPTSSVALALEMSEIMFERDSLGVETLRGRSLYYCSLLQSGFL